MENRHNPTRRSDEIRMESIIRTENVYKYFNPGTSVEVCALNDITLEIFSRQFVVFFGPSGSGKTTLLSIIGTIERPTKGSVFLGRENVSRFSDVELSRIKQRTLGFVFQNYNLLFRFSAWENVAFPLIPLGVSEKERYRRASEVIRKVGLEKRMHHAPEEMSGGEQQRVAIARALINDPEIVIADEPTSNIDARLVENILEIFRTLNHEGRTIIVTSHNPVFLESADVVFYLEDGNLVKVKKKEREDGTKRL